MSSGKNRDVGGFAELETWCRVDAWALKLGAASTEFSG